MKNKHEDETFFTRMENKFKVHIPKYTPPWLETYHLTMMAIPEAGLCILGGYLAGRYDLNWLWIMNIGVIAHYITDCADGVIGRHRNTGLIRWGFYMDHFTDFLLLCSIFLGYFFIIPVDYQWTLLVAMAAFGLHFVNAFLFYGATGRFEIGTFGYGPTELRLTFIIINIMLIFMGRVYLAFLFVPFMLVFVLALIPSVLAKSKIIWELDMKEKAERDGKK